MATQMLWREAQARVHALRGEHAEAEHFAREAISLIEGSDDAIFRPDAWVTLARSSHWEGRPTRPKRRSKRRSTATSERGTSCSPTAPGAG